ncbi:MAG: hypothetical protein KF774_10490 [Planctomyces sp.]|nr:hypothetical protein [Planctomyces sp.]
MRGPNEGGTFEVHVQGVVPDLPGITVSELLEFSALDNQGRVELTGQCSIGGYMIGEVAAEPRLLTILVDRINGGFGTVRLSHSAQRELRFVSVVDNCEGSRVIVGELMSSEENHVVEYSMSASSDKVLVKGTLEFQLESAGSPLRVNVPYMCILKSK